MAGWSDNFFTVLERGLVVVLVMLILKLMRNAEIEWGLIDFILFLQHDHLIFLFLFLLLDLLILLGLIQCLNDVLALASFFLTILQVVSEFPFHYYVVLRVCALDELVDTEEIQHEFEWLSISLKVLLCSYKRHFLTELEPDKNQRKKDSGQD